MMGEEEKYAKKAKMSWLGYCQKERKIRLGTLQTKSRHGSNEC
jgi:hypothetical protein